MGYIPYQPTKTERYRQMVLEVSDHGRNLTDWELNFIADMDEKFDKYGSGTILSDAQKDTIDRIHRDRM